MAIYYSKTKKAFYDTAVIAVDLMPADKVEITSDEYAALMEAQASGSIIVADANGKPTALKQSCGECNKTTHELVVASDKVLGHTMIDSLPTTGSQNAVASGGVAFVLQNLDEDYVKRFGDKEIDGFKTFKKSPSIANDAPTAIMKATGTDKGTAPTELAVTSAINAYDKNGTQEANRLGSVGVTYDTEGNIKSSIKAYKPEAESTDSAEVAVVYPASGEPYATAPTPPTGDDTNKIATTEWVNARETITRHTIEGDVVFDCWQRVDHALGIQEYWGVIPIMTHECDIEFTFPRAFSASPLVMLSSEYDRVSSSPGESMPMSFSNTKDSVVIMGYNPAYSQYGDSKVHFLIRGFI